MHRILLFLFSILITSRVFASGDTIALAPFWQAESNKSNTYLGSAMCFADVNGDGFDDAIVGAKSYDNVQSNEGAIYVYLSTGITYPITPSLIIESNVTSAYFGETLTNAGDVNNDGYEDILVGCNWSNVESNEGKAWLFAGSATGLNPTPLWTKEGNEIGYEYGEIICGDFDYNNDGYDDALFANSTSTIYDGFSHGDILLLKGSSTGYVTTPVWELHRETEGFSYDARFAAADLNADGLDDLMIYDIDTSTHGVEFFLATPTGFPAVPNFTSNDFGIQYAGPFFDASGDINNDGFIDLIISDPYRENAGGSEGAIDIYYGPFTTLGTPDTTIISAYLDNNFGTYCGISDMNGDNYADIFVDVNSNYPYTNAILIYASGPDGIAQYPGFEFTEIDFSYEMMANCHGDMNNDGRGDFLVSNDVYSNPSLQEGIVYLFTGASNFNDPPPLSLSFISADDLYNYSFSQSLSAEGDFNSDGITDLIVGEPHLSHPSSAEGKAYIFYGSPIDPLGSPDWSYESNQANCEFGSEVNSAGDFNNDGFDDVMIGAPYYTYTDNNGAAFIFKGGTTTISNYPNWVFTGDPTYIENGYSLTGVGDINGDTYDDIVIGSPAFSAHDDPYFSQARVFHGTSGWADTSPDALLINDSIGGYGFVVKGFGDVNGDGFNDVLVSENQYSPYHPSAAYIYTGSAVGLNTTPFWSYFPPVATSDFGYSADISEDINGDGADDILIGSPFYSNGETSEGAAYVFYGGSTISSTPDWKFENNNASSELGLDVTCGDINDDGYADVFVSAPFYSFPKTNSGIVYIFYGFASGIRSMPSYYFHNSLKGNSYFGKSLEFAKDMTGDGIGDLVTGTWYTSTSYHGFVSIYEGKGSTCDLIIDTISTIRADNSLQINWSDDPDAVIYDVRWKAVGSVDWTTITTTLNTYLISGLDSCTNYQIDIIPECTFGSASGISITLATTGCALPCNLVTIPFINVTSITASSALVSWGEPEEAVSYYLRYKPVAAATWITFELPVNSVTLATLSACTNYEVQIKSDCGVDTSYWSASTLFTTTCAGCATAPTGLFADNITSTSAKLHWSSDAGATKYKLYYKIAAGGAWIKVNATSNFKTISGLTAATNYQYKVKTICAGGIESEFSVIQSFTTLPMKAGELSELNMIVAPSPNNGKFTLNYQGFENAPLISIYNLLGELVFETKAENMNSETISLNEESGIYIIKLSDGNQQLIQKFLIN